MLLPRQPRAGLRVLAGEGLQLQLERARSFLFALVLVMGVDQALP